MSKRKLDSSTEARGFTIRSCIKDPRLKRVFFVGCEPEGVESNGKGGADARPFESGNGKEPVTEGAVKDAPRDSEKDEKESGCNLIESLDKVSNFAGGANRTVYLPRGILKKHNGSGWNRENRSQSTPPENIITVDNGPANNCPDALPKFRATAAPCSRQKLVKVPGSLSYRRLLPYLMEIDKDEVQVSTEQSITPNVDSLNSIFSENHDSAETPCSSTPNIETPEHINAPTLVSAVPQSSEILAAENIQSNLTSFTIEPLKFLPNSVLSENRDPSEILVSNTPNLETPEHTTGPTLVSAVPQSSEILAAENIQSNLTNFTIEPLKSLPNSVLSEKHDPSEILVSNTPNSETPEHTTAPILVSALPQSSENLAAENIQSYSTSFTIEPLKSSPNSILSENLDPAEILVSNTPNLETSQHVTAPILVSTVAESSDIPTAENIQFNSTNFTVEPQPLLEDPIQAMEVLCNPQLAPSLPSIQGTLTIDELASRNVDKMGEVSTSIKMSEIKSDARGCKGTCMCLDCVLFRTNAERSFEFSKKQLNEADEIIRGLVTEICSLRRILEKSIGNRCSDCSQVCQDEIIKVVCEKASLAEKLATMRTKQMFMDSNTHCK